MELKDVPIYARTVLHLRPAQVAHRLRLRGQQAVVERFAGPSQRLLGGSPPAHVGWPPDFVSVDAQLSWPAVADLGAGQLTLLGQTRALGEPPDWCQTTAARLWSFHLHYWDWAWGLAQDSDRPHARSAFARLWRSYAESIRFGHPDAWAPYVVSLRAWTLCGLYAPLIQGGELDEGVRRCLVLHAGFLKAHLEFDVGGNHLVKNLKALVGLGVFLGDERLTRRSLGRLVKQLSIQVLDDGGHYERAPAYHCQVLGDLIDVMSLLKSADRPVPAPLVDAVDRMRLWLGAVLLPDGTVPMLNDGFPVPPDFLAALGPLPAPSTNLVVLVDSGLVIGCKGNLHLLADVGEPCPRELPAHAHADTFSYVLFVDGRPLVVDPGTSTYAAGPARSRERSTGAHNTVELDSANSTEVWGAFRAGRRAHVYLEQARDDGERIVIRASHDGYRHLSGSPRHRRTWTLSANGLRIEDEVSGVGVHQAVAHTQLAPGIAARPAGGHLSIIRGDARIADLMLSPSAQLEHRSVATGHESVLAAMSLEQRAEGPLPLHLTAYWQPRTRDSGIKPVPAKDNSDVGVKA